MEQKLSQNNITFSFSNVMLISTVISLIIFVGISIAFSQPVSSEPSKTDTFIPDIRSSSYGVVNLSITSKNTGTGSINLDGYLVPVDFNFDTQEYLDESGSSQLNVEITRLDIGQIVASNGNKPSDFTNHQDHKNINEALKNFIEVNKLVEVR